MVRKSGKKALAIALSVVALAAGVLALLAARYEPSVRSNTFIGVVNVGGLTPTEARRALRVWWERAKQRPLAFSSDRLETLPAPVTPGRMGISLDDEASLAPAALDGFGSYLLSPIANQPRQMLPIRLRLSGKAFERFKRFIADGSAPRRPARARWIAGKVALEPEDSGFELDEGAFEQAVLAAVTGDGVAPLPLRAADKRVDDAQLAQIREVMAEYSTTFSASDRNRSHNIELAAGKLDGAVLLPGESLSFNNMVGPRTPKAGFKEAGVFANGRKDIGIGGGICQVSSTMYNAALFGNLTIVKRRNHSLPVAYVPIGRDATVVDGVIDFVVGNPYPYPVSISAVYQPGKLTFRVLGVKDRALRVEMVADGFASWSPGSTTVLDPRLPAGTRKVLERGIPGRSLNTYRLVYRNGKLVAREPQTKSVYRPTPAVIAVGPQKPKDPAEAPPGSAGIEDR